MDENMITMHISGSTQNIYTVTINLQHANIFCNCPDHKTRHNSLVCKHCCFVLYRVLRIFTSTAEHFFVKLTFTPDEMGKILLAYTDLNATLDTSAAATLDTAGTSTSTTTIVNKALTEKYRAMTATSTNASAPPKPKPRHEAGDECGVCFLEVENTDKSMACPKCLKLAHAECLEVWIANKNVLCIYCRQDVWRNARKPASSSSEYKNLNN